MRLFCLFGVLFLAGCNAHSIVEVPQDGESHKVDVPAGETFDVILGNVGPGEFESPPRMSSNALTFVAVDVIPPFNPGGPTQRFRFKAVGLGQSIIHFRRIDNNAVIRVVDDTIQVR